MGRALKIARVGGDCVACGSCVGACPMGAIRIASGVIAQIDGEKCVGCGKCAKICPAAVITVVERRAAE
ncbi:4Fe-4S binding protein [Butyricicoccus faecihominis]|uniref:4Fe-4S dicluster domain-containing protein n=1 Tax=Butyricicoccaceae TaxID=3085642 RepID=UPI002479FF53|nr:MULTISPECIES: 4Fe-4S dicluster domain-containing protein [Butyricicoccaceae]MCQ5130990.1 4Fe-4S binding protein [Butyricicoccus faecihominis]WNX84840.1 4Fe-4S binding protein [Agathobaculum sp. NTUH-O15-33]